MEFAKRNLSDITRNSEYLRFDTDVEMLKKSIENVGLIHPLTVNENNELLAGARRFQAVSELGWTEVDVIVVDRGQLEQELISIDENLVRAPLNKLELEKCLNRGREIYETLNPEATKINLSPKEATATDKDKPAAEEESETPADSNSFSAITAQKTGLSKSVIESAIKRDELASESVKRARGLGELNASQTNAIIELDKEAQEEILPLIADKTVKETKKIIDAVKKGGIEAAKQENATMKPLPKEYSQMRSPLRRVSKSLSRILLEGLTYDGPEKEQINKEMLELKQQLDNYFAMMNEH